MIRTGKQELCSAGNRAESTYLQLITVNQIVIQNIVLLKIPWIIHKVVIHCVVTNLYARFRDYIFQIYRLGITCSRIYFVLRYSHFIILHVLISIKRLYRLLQCSVSPFHLYNCLTYALTSISQPQLPDI